MKNYNKFIESTGETRLNCRGSFLNVFTPRDREGKNKYEATILIDKKDTEAVKLLNEAIERAKAQYTEKFGKPKSKLKTWIKDGDEERPDDDNYAGKLYFSAKSDHQPVLKVLENGTLMDALDEDDIYSGAYYAAILRFYPYKTPDGTSGISCGLNGLIKVEDGPRLGGGSSDAAYSDLA